MITSGQNPKLKLVRALQGRAKERREAGLFVVEGVRLVEEAVKTGWPFQFVLFSDTLSERGKELLKTLAVLQVEVEEASGDLLQNVSETETPQGILAVLKFNQIPIPGTPDFVLIPDQIRDPGNLGTLLRTAAGAGVQAVLLPPETADAFAPKVLRSGMGAHFRLPIHFMIWDEIGECVKNLHVYLADMNGQSCWETDLRQPLALVIGGEAEGASEESQRLATQQISIPMRGDMESLNAGVAGSILMFEAVRQRSHI
ncbi:MAG TPA: RNA methyltransferase [Anaerolineales bacterium]|nr:RNA methyltransferase [Anaerolineales bacterium]